MARYYRRPAIVDQIPLDRHCVIEASAGTGKTFTIEHLVIEILLNSGTRLDQILAVTFTEKTAAELRGRIRNTIEKTLRGDIEADDTAGEPVALDEDKIRRLEGALFSFDRAPIHTIHSFCHRMLTELAFQSGARLKVELADASAMFHEAFRAALRERFAAEEWMRRVLEEWLADDRDIDSLERLLLAAYQRRYVESGAAARNFRALRELLASFDQPMLMRELRSTRTRGAVSDLEAIGDAIKRSNRDPALLHRELDARALKRVAGLERMASLSAEARRLLSAVRLAQFAITLEARAIDTFLPHVAERLDRLKRERGAIDFGDMPGWLWSALEGPNGARLAATLRERFRFALVDEFQDTDDLQWKIFERVFVYGGENRIFVIGDAKQAIYSFRDADVFTYLQAKKALCEQHGAAFVPLIRNFRSTSDMVEAINLIFASAPSPAFFASGQIRYDHPVLYGRSRFSALRKDVAIKSITIFSLPANTKLSARNYRQILGRRIAATLKSLLTEKDALEIGDRRIRASEIFVLTRTRMESREIAAYLREVGVPFAFYKQDGLFQTREAGHVLDALRAVAEPHRRSHRLKAWSTPFFGVALRDLPGLDNVPPTHPLMMRLLEWKALADAERYADLFNAMLHQSGLAARELLLADSQRELTNYEHLFEILLESAMGEARDLLDLVEMLASWVDERDLPRGENPGVQRIESEREAVQIMTVHKAKGLEADVVVLFGGYARGPQRYDVTVFHDNGVRQIIAGSDARAAAKRQIDAESSAEDERLVYVALTRTRAKLYLAMFPNDSTRAPLNGYYQKLNDRLTLLATGDSDAGKAFRSLAEVVPLAGAPLSSRTGANNAIGSWIPPKALLSEEQECDLSKSVAAIVSRHPALSMDSYTSLQRRSVIREEAEYEFEVGPLEGATSDDLAGGRAVGVFLHEVIESLDLAQLATARDPQSWGTTSGVIGLIDAAARRNRVPNRASWLERGVEIVFNALRSPIALGDIVVPAIASCPGTREMEFTFPIPAHDHRLLDSKRDGNWRIDRGLLVGFVDFVFRHGGRTYFADWKSDVLRSYDATEIEAHVSARYLIQARIYTIGIIRLLRIQTRQEYEERFGGLLYVFLRGVKPDGDGRTGVYFHRPGWDEVVSYEKSLMSAV